MSGERFQEQDKGSFFGDFLYDRIVPADHFLRHLQALIPWKRFTKKLVRLYRGKARRKLKRRTCCQPPRFYYSWCREVTR